jgi:hypothetical protein
VGDEDILVEIWAKEPISAIDRERLSEGICAVATAL